MNLLNLTTTEITLFNTICLIKDIKKINNDCFEMVCYAPLIDNKGKEIGYVDIYIPCVTKEVYVYRYQILMERMKKMYTAKTLGEWGAELKRLNKAIAYLNGIYKVIPGTEDKEIVLTALKCVENRHDIIVDTLIEIEVPDIL